MKAIQIAIDGPASSGKSTVAKIIAKNLGYTYLDTGAMYRCATYLALKNDLTAQDVSSLLSELAAHPISFGKAADGSQKVFLGDCDVTLAIRQHDVTNNVSWVSALPEIRAELVAQQQRIATKGGIVMDGRDIGTTVFPDAELKIFVTASAEVRAQRRFDELKSKGQEASYDEILHNVKQRDYLDQNREVSPLRQASDAILLDNSTLTIEEQKAWLINQFNRVVNP